ncbi:unnamed protein product, partial [Durusdinium trenchii]
MRRGVMIAEGRTVQDGCQEKWLPCGTMKEYWVQYKQQSSDNADWESAAGIAKAFAIGRAESSAVLALLSNVPGHVCSKLNEIVKIRGMTRFLTHDVIGKGTFSIGWTSGVLACEGWSDQLTNSARDHTLVTRMCIQEFRKVDLYLERLVSDHDSVPEQLRRAWSYKDAVKLHQATGAFLWCLDQLQKIAPASQFDDMKKSLRQSFFAKFLDLDLIHMLEEKSFAEKISQGRMEEKEEKAMLAKKELARATYQHVLAMLESDVKILEEQLPGPVEAAAETALDMKYIRDRQQKGKAYVADFCSKNFILEAVNEDLDAALPKFLSLLDSMRGIAGKMYVVCSLDFIVYPAAATYVRKAFECLANVAAMSSSHIGFIFMPVHQKQTTEPAVLKHRRQIEENLMKSKMSLANEVCILFAKPEARVTDGRAMTQISLLSLRQNYTSNSDWNSSSAVTTARIGPAPLIRISDMKGVDCFKSILEGLMKGMEIKEADRLVVLDIVPNRQCEMGRAVLQKVLDGENIKYMGFLREDVEKDLRSAMESVVYQHWDSSADAPPKQRPQESKEKQDLKLEILAMKDGSPVFPEQVLMDRFTAGSEYHKEVQKMKAKFEEKHGRVGASTGTSATTTTSQEGRVSGVCDFTIDEGLSPLDTSREVSLPVKTIDQLGEPSSRIGTLVGKAGKPTVVLDKDFGLWLLNPGDAKIKVPCSELCGFGTGAYKNGVV